MRNLHFSLSQIWSFHDVDEQSTVLKNAGQNMCASAQLCSFLLFTNDFFVFDVLVYDHVVHIRIPITINEDRF